MAGVLAASGLSQEDKARAMTEYGQHESIPTLRHAEMRA